MISFSPKAIALSTLAPKDKPFVFKSLRSAILPNVLARHTSFTKEVDEKSITEVDGRVLWTG